MAYVISDDCIACGTCIDECPVGAISEGDKYSILVSMNARLAQFLKVTNILSTRICVQNAVLAQMYVLLKQSTKDNRFNRLF